jgi:hypothetical protein
MTAFETIQDNRVGVSRAQQYLNDKCFEEFFQRNRSELLHEGGDSRPVSPTRNTSPARYGNHFATDLAGRMNVMKKMRERAERHCERVIVTSIPIPEPPEREDRENVEETTSPRAERPTENRYTLHTSDKGTSYKYRCSTCGRLGRNRRTCLHKPLDESSSSVSPTSNSVSPNRDEMQQAKRSYKCSICKHEGHNKNNCPQRYM